MPTVQWITPVFDRTLADCVYGNQKGAITAEVLNRIENNVEYLRQLFEEYNISFNRDITTDTAWQRQRYFRISDLRRIELNVLKLRQSMLVEESTPTFTPSLEETFQIYTHYNDIERICQDLSVVFQRLTCDFLYCGEFWCGYNKDGLYYELGGGKARYATGVTFTATQIGGQHNVSDTTRIQIVFDQPVTYLSAEKIQVESLGGQITPGALTGSGTTYYLEVASVEAQGTIALKILPFGDFYTTTGTYQLEVYRARQITVTLVSGGATQGVSSQLVFHVVAENTPDDIYEIALTPAIPGVTVGELILTNSEGDFIVNVDSTAAAGRYQVTIVIDGITSQTFSLDITAQDFLYTGEFIVQEEREHVFGSPKYATAVTFVAEQIGGVEDQVSTTQIKIIFSLPVSYLKVSDIVVRDITGSIEVGALTGEGAVYYLEVTKVALQGSVGISIGDFADFQVTTPEQLLTIYKGRTISVREQIGAVSEGVAGEVSYQFLVDGILDGIYVPTFVGLPENVTFSNVVISGGVGSVTLYVDEDAVSGKYQIQMQLNAVTSTPFTLAITACDFLYTGEFYAQTKRDYQHFEAGAGRAKYVTNISFIAEQVGGVENEESTSQIKITFSQAVSYFTLSEVSVLSDTGAVKIGKLSGSGAEWLLEVTEVLRQGNVTVVIEDFSNYVVSPSEVSVAVYRGRTISVGPQLSAVSEGLPGAAKFVVTGDGIQSGTYIPVLLGAPVGVVVASLTFVNGQAVLAIVTREDTPTGVYACQLQVDGLTSAPFEFAVSVEDFLYTGEFWVQQNKDDQMSEGASKARAAIPVTYSVEQIGGIEDQESTSQIKLVFSRAVSYLTASNIIVTPLTGKVTVGTLSGEGAEWLLEVTMVSAQGEIQISVSNFADYYLEESERVHTLIVYRGRSVIVGEQMGAIAYGLPGSLKFPVDTFDVADGVYSLNITGAPEGVTIDETVAIKNSYGEFKVTTEGAALPGKYYLQATIDTIQSNTFMLAITN